MACRGPVPLGRTLGKVYESATLIWPQRVRPRFDRGVWNACWMRGRATCGVRTTFGRSASGHSKAR